ncbi:MAG TPA: helix-turn-helix domain-containing protein [Chthonomonadaceae bacterium]|nr:helix-turn-helix domain-containing protein [Chthonomonadaceae bacterium]
MDRDQENTSLSARRGLSITEAALRLGVSERTVYRMLREGKLRRLMSDKSGRNVRLDEEDVELTNARFAIVRDVLSDNMSDKVPADLLEELRQELREKDEQIARLIEQQREMSVAMQRLQDQMFELARLTLSQNSVTYAPSQSQPSIPIKADKRWWWPWSRR